MRYKDHKFITVVCGDCLSAARTVMIPCGDRTCSVDRHAWAESHEKSLLEAVKSYKNPRTVTLTIKNISDTAFSKACISNKKKTGIRDNFTKLRHQKFYAERIRGGFYIIQSPNRGNGWHLHIHFIYDGAYIPVEKLREDWKALSGGFEVFISKVKTPENAVDYLLSEFQGEVGQKSLLDCYRKQYNSVFKNTRIIQGFGTCYKSHPHKAKIACPVCKALDSWIPFNRLDGLEAARVCQSLKDGSLVLLGRAPPEALLDVLDPARKPIPEGCEQGKLARFDKSFRVWKTRMVRRHGEQKL